jgi:hypothetical protein
MAGVALLLKYQWRAYWRRFSRGGGQALSQALLLFLLGWMIFIKLPPLLLEAANDLAAGKTERTEGILLACGFGWLFLLHEDTNISIAAKNLIRFPLSVNTLLGVRVLSMFISPVVMMIVIGSLMSLFPFLTSRNPVTGIAAAILFLSLAAIVWLCLSHLMRITAWRRGLSAASAIIIIPLGASLLASGDETRQRLLSMITFTPAGLATSAATSVSLQSVLISLLLLLVFTAAACFLLLWSFRQSLSAQQMNRSSWIRKIGIIRLPGRLGGLVGKEQRYFLKTYFPWLGLLFALACSLALLKNSIPPIVFQSAILLVFLIDFDLTTNFFGLDRAWELNRYLIFPLRGREIAFSKNLGIVVIVAAQLAPMLSLACWRFGWMEAGLGLIEATALMLAYLAWGNLRSVNNPYKMDFLQLSTRENLIYALAGLTIGSLPGVAIIYLVRLNSDYLTIKISFILLLAAAVYFCSMRYAGRKIERSWQTISDRLS